MRHLVSGRIWQFGAALAAGLLVAAGGSALPGAENAPAANTATILKWPEGKKAVFLLEFDDSCDSHIKNAIPELKKRGLVGTFFINPGAGHFQKNKAAWEKEVPATTAVVYGNHTLTHKGVQNVEELDKELAGCNEEINLCFPQRKQPRLISFGKPGGVPWKVSKEEEQAMLTKYHLIKRPPFFGPPIHVKTREQILAVIDKAIASGEMGHLDFHGVGGDWLTTSRDDFLAILDKLVENKAQLWITDPVSWHQYETERKGAALKVDSADGTGVKLTLACQTDPQLYDYPLTATVPVPAEWKSCTVEQNGTKTVFPCSSGQAMIQLLPVSGSFTLTPATN